MLGLLWLQSFATGRIIRAPDGRPIGTARAFHPILRMYLLVGIVTGGDIFL